MAKNKDRDQWDTWFST